MKCCVQNCVNSGKVNKINQPSTSTNKRITYHLFPKDPIQQEIWQESLTIPDSMLTNRSVICSDHFKEDDFYMTKQGTRRIKNGAVPFIQDDCYEHAALRVCKVCLSVDSKIYHIRDHGLDIMYEDVMGMPPRTDDQNRLPMVICWECTARLQSASSFRSKALFSDALLQDHLKNNADLKIVDIQNILQDHSELKSTISIQDVFKFNSHNIEYLVPNTYMKTEVINIPVKEEIEDDAQDLERDKSTIKDGKKNILTMQNLPNTNFQTKLDRKLTKIETGDEEASSDDDHEMGTENVHVNRTRRGLRKVLKNEKDIESIDTAAKLSYTMETDDNDFGKKSTIEESDDEDNKSNFSDDVYFKINLRNKTVKCAKVKPNKRGNKNGGAKTKKNKVSDERAKTKEPYPKPLIPLDENVFAERKLDHEDLRREVLARRQSDKYIYASFKCDVCYVGFKTKARKERHMIKHSEKSGPYECDICHVRLKTRRYHRAHINRAHTVEFTCKLCAMVTRIRNVAVAHMRYHAGKKFKCTQCSLEFEKPTTLKSHERLKHMSSCVCELCGYTFLSEKGIQIHKRTSHKLFDANTKLKGPHCDVCNVKFLTKKAYKLHLRLSSKHITEDDPKRMYNDSTITPRPFVWAMLDKPVMRPVIHVKNEFAPVNNGPITCEQCGVVQESLREYATHFKYAHPGVTRMQSTYATTPYMCEQCGKFFPNSTTLSYHMWVHTGRKLFQCDYCKKAFAQKGKLSSHIQQEHLGKRRTYGCPDCGKHFKFSYNLRRHMILHTGLKPFNCDTCDKAFSTLGELRAHVNHVHLKIPRPKRAPRKRDPRMRAPRKRVKSEQSDNDNDEN